MARSFNGSTDVAYGSPPLTARPLTFACWFNPANVTTAMDLMAITQTGSTNDGYRLSLRGDLAGDFLIAGARAGGTQANATTSTGYTASTWHHGCAVFGSTTSRAAYLDGGSKGANATSISTSTSLSRVSIGGYSSTSLVNPTNGSIAVPCVWNVALSDAEVASLASGLHPSLVQPSAIVALWPLAGASPEPDTIGGFDLTLTGTTHVADPPLSYGSGRLKRVGYNGGFAAPYNGGLAG